MGSLFFFLLLLMCRWNKGMQRSQASNPLSKSAEGRTPLPPVTNRNRSFERVHRGSRLPEMIDTSEWHVKPRSMIHPTNPGTWDTKKRIQNVRSFSLQIPNTTVSEQKHQNDRNETSQSMDEWSMEATLETMKQTMKFCGNRGGINPRSCVR